MSLPKNQQDVIAFASLCTHTTYYLQSPTLWTIDPHGNYRMWIIHIAVEGPNGDNLELEPEWLDRTPLPDGAQAKTWTIAGVEDSPNMQTSEPTHYQVGKNIGRSNYTTAYTQAILDAASTYAGRLRKGCSTNKESLKKPGQSVSFADLISNTERGSHPWRVYPNALHTWEKDRDKITYPAYIQPKYDGIMAVVVYHPSLPKLSVITPNGPRNIEADIYTRGRENIESQTHILAEIAPILKICCHGIHLVGELWKKGYNLEDISGSSRRLADSKREQVKLEFHVFDLFDIDHPDWLFPARLAKLQRIFAALEKGREKWKLTGYVKLAPTTEVKDASAIAPIHAEHLTSGYEGSVVRSGTNKYEYGINKELRSHTALKLKPRPDAEWPVIGFTDGESGKDVGAVVWICAETDADCQTRYGKILPYEERRKFNVTPNLPYADRYRIYQLLTEKPEIMEKLRGQLLTINYSILSNFLLPQQPKAKRFREQQYNDLILLTNIADDDDK